MKTSSTSRSILPGWHFRLLAMLTLLMYVTSSVGVLVGQSGMPGCRCAQGDPGPNGCCCRAKQQVSEKPALPACCSTRQTSSDSTESQIEDRQTENCQIEDKESPSTKPECCSVAPAPVPGCCSTGTQTQTQIQTPFGCCGTSNPDASPGLYALCTCGSQHPSGLICNSDPRLLSQESVLSLKAQVRELLPGISSVYAPPLLLLDSPPPRQSQV